jgi:hypothetical protein
MSDPANIEESVGFSSDGGGAGMKKKMGCTWARKLKSEASTR